MTYRWFKWARTEAEAAELQSQGGRICDGALAMHHAEYALLIEIPEHVARAYGQEAPI